MTLSLLLEFLIVLKEPTSCLDDFSLIDSPKVFEVVDDACFLIEGLQNFLIGHVVETQDTVTDSCRLEYLNPSHFRSVIAVRSTACLHIHSFDVYHSDLVPRYNTSLIQVESVLRLSLFLP